MIRIINGGNSATELDAPFDERVIESVVELDAVSFVVDVTKNVPTFKRLRTDEDVSDYIANLVDKDAISRIETDEQSRDILIYLRQLGEDILEIGENDSHTPEVIVL